MGNTVRKHDAAGAADSFLPLKNSVSMMAIFLVLIMTE